LSNHREKGGKLQAELSAKSRPVKRSYRAFNKQMVFFVAIVLFIGCSGIRPNRAAAPGQKDLVIVLHGLGSTKGAMWLLGERIQNAGFRVKTIGYASLYKTPEQVLADVTGRIESILAENSGTVHFVGHSLGGLMIRAYLDANAVEHLGRVVLIGSPNSGTVFVDHFKESWWLDLLGPLPRSLGTDEDSFPNSIGPPYYPVGIIAGVTDRFFNEDILPGSDDGIVPLNSAKLPGMTDMVVVRNSHSMMLYDQKVASRTVGFLKSGRFSNDSRSTPHPIP
jgi:pimeloyl-ACP methyl ester carboxylesterase